MGQPDQPQRPPIKPNLPYCCSFNLLPLKLLEIGFTVASLAVALRFEGPGPIVCIEIVTALVIVTTFSWSILYCLNLNARFPEFFPLLIFVYHLVMTLLMVISMICAAYMLPQFKASIYPQYLICTFTSLVAALLFLIDTVLSAIWWRGGNEIAVFPCSPWQQELTL